MEDGVREEGKSHESSNQEKVMEEAEAVAVIVSEVKKLESLLLEKANIDIFRNSSWLTDKPYIDILREKDAKDIIDEVKKIVEKVRDMKWEEKRKLKYLISDVVEDVGEAHRQIEVGDDSSIDRMHSILDDFKEINDGFHQLLQNDGVGEGERDGDGDGDVVGLEEDVELLLHKMKPITHIRGYDGFGKTTLARQLYNHADVVERFKLRAWINCFDILGRKELLINILQQVASSEPKDVEKMELEGLRNMFRQQLRGKRYFIVLDNIWRYECLKFVKESLPPNDKESKLLVTRGPHRILSAQYRVGYSYIIKLLDEDNSWKLLLKTMFPTCSQKFPKKLERKGKQMLMKHTGGVPLAIKDVGMEWAQKRMSGSEWEEIVDSNDLELRASLQAIESSFYHYLEPDDKSRFLYIGLFKQGIPINRHKFKQTWNASKGRPLSEEKEHRIIGEELIFHKIRIGIDKKGANSIKNHEVGAIFHKLAIKKAKEGNNGASHRVIYCSREGINSPTDQDERLISLFFNGGGCFDASPSYWKCFQQLRVLDFEGFGLKSLPETVGELIELRYLGLKNNYLQQLPSSLGCLKNLEVLDIALNFMVEVPDIIWEMEALVHLYMSDIFFRNPLKIEALKKLETLTYISVDNWTYEVSAFRMITSLRKLGIEELNENSNVSKLFASAAMKNLECLVLRGSRFRSMPSLEKLGAPSQIKELKLDGLITMLPKAKNFPRSLQRLSLVNSYFDEDPMPVLEKLSGLHYLKLQNAYTGRQMVISEGGFPKLTHLCIRELWNLRNIQVGRGTLRELRRLEITSCPCLQNLPAELTENINKLEMVTTKNIAAKIKKLDLFSKKPAYAVVDIQP